MAGNAINRTSSAPMKTILPPQELLDDLCSRFVLNVPQEDLESFERIFFLLEQAHWFYEDNSVEQNPALKSLSFKEFSSLMFNNCAALRPYINHIDDIYKDFTTYKFRVPVSGAIILDESYERCLLVKGWKVGASWSFPRGKKSKDEEDHTCAYREEISWHRLDEILPASEEVFSRGTNGLKLYMVAPFLAALKAWIAAHPPPPGQKTETSAKGVCVWKVKSSSLGGGGSTADNQSQKAVSDAQDAADVRPGRSFRNFRFDFPSILHSMEAVFSAK